jgi:predicted acyltransferase
LSDPTGAVPAPAAGPVGRLASLDQFRGYTVLGMIAVNLLGRFAAVPAIFEHHNTYCSYADTIMPQFFFAVGFAYRLTYLRRVGRDGPRAATRHAIARGLGLVLFGVVFYGLDGEARTWAELRALGPVGVLAQALWRGPFQALVHIGVTSLWVLPVVGARARWRVLFLVLSAALHVGLSWAFYYEAACLGPRKVIDGGPLGFLTWTIPLLVGSLAYDAVAARGARRAFGVMVGWSVVLMLLGYALSCVGPRDWAAPPFVPPWHAPTPWAMSQRAGSVSYLTFAAGLSLLVYALFALACDAWGFGWGVFRTFGGNALAAYVLHAMVGAFLAPYGPKDAPAAFVVVYGVVALALCWLFVRHLERQKIFIRM